MPSIISGLKTGYIDLSYLGSGIMGYTDASKKVSYVDINLYEAALENPTSSEARRFRATVAHEVAHCLYHFPYLKTFKSVSNNTETILMRKRSDIPAYQDLEWQAWEQAGALLMPKPCLKQLLAQRKTIKEIAEVFNVNPAFVEIRIDRLKKQKK